MIAAKAPRSKEDLLRISKQELRKEACCSMLHAMFMWIFTSLRDGNRPHRIVGQPLVTANDVGH